MEQPIMQQPIRKIVGRPRDPRQVLTRLYDLQIFARNITRGRELIREGDYFSVRNVIDRAERSVR